MVSVSRPGDPENSGAFRQLVGPTKVSVRGFNHSEMPLLGVIVLRTPLWARPPWTDVDDHAARILDHEMPLAPFLGSELKENRDGAVLESFELLIDILNLKRIDHAMARVGRVQELRL